MPRYFFHVCDGENFIDLQGTELADLHVARAEAVRFAAALLTEKAETFWGTPEWRLRVTDASNLTLFELFFHAVDSPATGRHDVT